MSFQDEIKKLRELAIINEDVNKILERMTGKELVSYEGIDVLVKELMTFYNSELKKKALLSHTHDDIYYTESEVDNLLNGKANTNHNHDFESILNNYRIHPKIIGSTTEVTNFDDLIEIGIYYNNQWQGLYTNGFLGAEQQKYNEFTLIVLGSGVATPSLKSQILIERDKRNIYIRSCTTWKEPWVWSPWEKIALSKELDSKLENYCPYKIGDVYITTNSSNPSSVYLGTTWQKIPTGKYIKTGDTALQTGGSNSITITKNNLPNIKLKIDSFSITVPPHSHDIQRSEWNGDKWWEIPVQADERGNGGFTHTELNAGQNTGTASPYTETLGNSNPIAIQPEYITLNFWKRIS